MATERETASIDHELELARQDLQETMAQFTRKFEHTEVQLNPNELLRNHIVIAACVAAAAGFVIGGGIDLSPLEGLVLGALMSFRFWGGSSSNGPVKRSA
ncbi:MAG: hypothetical protein ACREQ4_09210 [Candidatus Binataceae bacterium]